MGEVTERDREIARKWLLVHIEGSHEGDAIFLAEFIAQVRAEERERCAGIAENCIFMPEPRSCRIAYENARHIIAKAIRSEKHP